MPVNYQGGKIYTIRAPETDKYYIGSTTQTLPKRFHSHKRDYACYQNGKMNNITSFQILELEGAYIELLELYPTNNKAELERREGQLIREHRDNCVNRIVVGRTKKEYREDNKERLNAKRAEKIQCECGVSVSNRNISRHRTSKRHIKFIEDQNE